MDHTCVFNFFTFFERILYESNCIIFIFSWCATHTKIRSKLVFIVTAGSQKISLWGPQRNPLSILRVKFPLVIFKTCQFRWKTSKYFDHKILLQEMIGHSPGEPEKFRISRPSLGYGWVLIRLGTVGQRSSIVVCLRRCWKCCIGCILWKIYMFL